MKHPIAICCCALGLGLLPLQPVFAAPQTLSELLQEVRASGQQIKASDAELLAEFRQQAAERQRMTLSAEAERDRLQQRQDQLQAEIAAEQEQIAALEEQLKQATEDLSGLFNGARQAAQELVDLRTLSYRTERPELPGFIHDGEALPGSEGLRQLWLAYLDALVEEGAVRRFEADLVLPDGSQEAQAVTRIGPFASLSASGYLSYLPSADQLLLMPRQPNLSPSAAQVQQASGIAAVTVDPSQGTLLQMAARAPSSWQRLAAGGLIGGLILLLGLVGLGIALYQWRRLGREQRQIQQQLKQLDQPADNPLGRVLLSARAYSGRCADALAYQLEEAVLAELPGLKRGLGTLAVLASIAPLLGLLGTVAGMIETFSAITAFGNQDPKILSGGISQALVTTELGLAVAVPLVLLHNRLSARSNRLVHLIEHQSAGLVAEHSRNSDELKAA